MGFLVALCVIIVEVWMVGGYVKCQVGIEEVAFASLKSGGMRPGYYMESVVFFLKKNNGRLRSGF